jgi:hypothetical protein
VGEDSGFANAVNQDTSELAVAEGEAMSLPSLDTFEHRAHLPCSGGRCAGKPLEHEHRAVQQTTQYPVPGSELPKPAFRKAGEGRVPPAAGLERQPHEGLDDRRRGRD